MYNFAINSNGINKNWNYETLTTGFQNRSGKVQDLADAIKKGHAFIGGHLVPGSRRLKSNMTGVNFITVEIDNATYQRDEDGKVVKGPDGKGIKIYHHQMSIEEALQDPFVKQYCALAYTSPSHTPEWPRFRLIFRLPRFLEGKTAEALTQQLMKVLPHDPACKDCARVFYGNTNAEIFILNEEAAIDNAWIAQAIQTKQRELADREKKRKERERWLQQHADEMEEIKANVLDALNYIPPRAIGGNNYPDCLRVLMVLKDLFGESEAEMLAESWSPSIPGSTWNIARKLRSFRNSGGVSVGTLFKLAIDNGYRFPEKEKKVSEHEVRRSEFQGGDEPKTLKEVVESVESRDNGYAALRVAISDILALNDPFEREYKVVRLCSQMAVPRSLVMRIISDITRRKNAKKTSYTLEDFIKREAKPLEWLIPSYLPKCGLTMMGGFAKDGKTTLLWKQCESLLTGRPFLNEKPTKTCNVLFIETEESENKIDERIESVGLKELYTIGRNLRIETSWKIDDLATLEQWIVEHKADVVYIDSLRKVSAHRGVSENSPEFADPVYELQGLVQSMGVACVILHHTNKVKDAEGLMKFAGTSSLLGATDNLIGFTRVSSDKQDPRRLLHFYGRDCEGVYQIEWEGLEYPMFDYKFIMEVGVSSDEKTLQGRILDAINSNRKFHPDGVSAAFLKNVLDLSIDDKSIYKPLKRLVDKQILGTRRRDGRAKLYYAVNPTPPSPSENGSKDYHSPESRTWQESQAEENSIHDSIHPEERIPSHDYGDRSTEESQTSSDGDSIQVSTLDTIVDTTSNRVEERGSAISTNQAGGEGVSAKVDTLTEFIGPNGLIKVGQWYKYSLDHLSKMEQQEWASNRNVAKLIGREGKVERLGYNEYGVMTAWLKDPYQEPFTAVLGCLRPTEVPKVKNAKPNLPQRGAGVPTGSTTTAITASEFKVGDRVEISIDAFCDREKELIIKGNELPSLGQTGTIRSIDNKTLPFLGKAEDWYSISLDNGEKISLLDIYLKKIN